MKLFTKMAWVGVLWSGLAAAEMPAEVRPGDILRVVVQPKRNNLRSDFNFFSVGNARTPLRALTGGRFEGILLIPRYNEEKARVLLELSDTIGNYAYFLGGKDYPAPKAVGFDLDKEKPKVSGIDIKKSEKGVLVRFQVEEEDLAYAAVGSTGEFPDHKEGEPNRRLYEHELAKCEGTAPKLSCEIDLPMPQTIVGVPELSITVQDESHNSVYLTSPKDFAFTWPNRAPTAADFEKATITVPKLVSQKDLEVRLGFEFSGGQGFKEGRVQASYVVQVNGKDENHGFHVEGLKTACDAQGKCLMDFLLPEALPSRDLRFEIIADGNNEMWDLERLPKGTIDGSVIRLDDTKPELSNVRFELVDKKALEAFDAAVEREWAERRKH